MPTYTYKCTNKECEHNAKPFEALQSITAGPIEFCPKCGQPIYRKIVRGASFVFASARKSRFQ